MTLSFSLPRALALLRLHANFRKLVLAGFVTSYAPNGFSLGRQSPSADP